MDTQSIISQKIREMAENNKRRDEAAMEAEKKMEEGFVSEPVVEQVKPKPKKKQSVSVQREPEKESGSAERQAEPEPQATGSVDPQPETADQTDVPEGKSDTKRTLNQSLEDMEKLLSENTIGYRATIVTPKVKEEERRDPDTDEKEPAEEPRNIRTTVKTNPRHRGPHAVHRRVVKVPEAKIPDEEPAEAPAGTPSEDPFNGEEYCLYEPLTGALNLLLRDRTIIGKSEQAHIVIKNRFVSRIHACIIRSGRDYYIEDLGSTNGSQVNGNKLEKGERVKLEAGDTITLAATKLIFDIKGC